MLVPALHGKGSPFADYERRVRLRNQSTGVDPSLRASMLAPQVDTVGRQVYLDAGGDGFTQRVDVETIPKTLRNYFRPDAPGHVCQWVADFPQGERKDQCDN